MGIKPRPESKLASRLDPGGGSDPGPAPAARPRHNLCAGRLRYRQPVAATAR